MQLEDYFDFLSPDDIRVKGHRIGIEILITEHLQGYSAEEIQARHPTLTLEEVYATLTYYLHNKAAMDQYVADWRAHGEEAWRRQQQEPPSPVVARLREIVRERRKAGLPLVGPDT